MEFSRSRGNMTSQKWEVLLTFLSVLVHACLPQFLLLAFSIPLSSPLSSRSLSASVLGHEQWTRATTTHGTERWTCMLVTLGCQKTGGATQREGLRRHRRWWPGVPPTEELMRARVGLSCGGGFIWGDSCPWPSISIRDCAIHFNPEHQFKV